MPKTAPRRRSGARTARARPSSIRRLLVADALRSWVPPTVAIVVLAVTMLLDALELVPDGAAAAIAVLALLVLGAFVATAPLLADEHDGRVAPWLVVAGATLWILVLAYPFATRLFRGEPLRQFPLSTVAKGELVASADQASRVDLVVDAHLPLASERRDRTVHYDVDLVDDAGTHERFEGELGDSWRMRRLGRRGSAPSHIEHLSAAHVVDVGTGATHVADVTLTGEQGVSAVATVYRDHVPPTPVLYGGAVLLALGALAFDLWWNPAVGVTATMVTLSACMAALVFSSTAGGHPGIRDVIGAALVGAVVGVPGAATAGWLARRIAPVGQARRRA